MRVSSWILLGAFLAGGCGQPGATPEQTASEPSQVLENFRMQDMRHGELVTSLVSTKARLFEEQNLAEVEEPSLVFYENGKESSRLNAPQGRVNTLTRQVEAWGGVTVVTTDSATLTTERLFYDPKTEKVSTNDPVRLEKPDSVTEGLGLESDPELKRVKIGKQRVRVKELP